MKKAVLTGLVSSAFMSLAALVALAQVTRSPSAEDAEVYFINVQDGDVVSSPLLVQFGLKNMGVAPAGFDAQNTGHHHLLINEDETAIDYDAPLPATQTLVHFGGGQTETTIELEPGEHTLQLLLGNASHIPHDEVVISQKITVTVE